MKPFSFGRFRTPIAPVVRRDAGTAETPGAGVNLRRNFITMLIDAVGWPLGQSFVSPQTILPLFIALLTKSSFVIGLVIGIQSVGQLVPQLLVANRLEQMEIKRFYVVIVGVIMERIPYLVLAAVVLLSPDGGVILLVFFICWVVANVGTGLNMPAFMGLYANAIPAALRGRLGGTGNAIGTLLAVGGAYVTSVILEQVPGLKGFSAVFAIGFVVLMASLMPLGLVDEPKAVGRAQRRPTAAYLREILPLLRANRPYARYVLMQVCMQLPFAATPFLTAYAVLKLGVTTEVVAYSTAVIMAATAIGSLSFGLFADRWGYRRVFLIGASLSLAAYGLMIFAPGLPVVFVCYFLAGLMSGSVYLGNNMTLEYCTPERAATYTAIVFTAGAPIRTLGPLILGLIADRLSMSLVFGIVAVSGLCTLVVGSAFVVDPRFARREAL